MKIILQSSKTVSDLTGIRVDQSIHPNLSAVPSGQFSSDVIMFIHVSDFKILELPWSCYAQDNLKAFMNEHPEVLHYSLFIY